MCGVSVYMCSVCVRVVSLCVYGVCMCVCGVEVVSGHVYSCVQEQICMVNRV